MNEASVSRDARFEIKFAANPIQMAFLESWVGSHPAGFLELYPMRQVNNVYFDTHDLFAYRENLSGASMRSKVRLRWYGELDHIESGALEVKRRRSGLGWKLSYPTGPTAIVGVPWSEIRRQLRRKLGSEARLWLDANPQAVLVNRYRRRYFESADRRLRLTLDWDQRVYDQRIEAVPNLGRQAHLPETIVIEFKFAPENRQLASDAIFGFPIRVSRNSKYVIGVQAIARG